MRFKSTVCFRKNGDRLKIAVLFLYTHLESKPVKFNNLNNYLVGTGIAFLQGMVIMN